MTAPHRLARRLTALACCAALMTAAAACGSSGGPSIPSFSAAPGRFRVEPQPTNGAPPPQTLSFQGHRVLATLSTVDGSGTGARAGLVLQVTDENALVPFREYRAGDSVVVGSLTVHIDTIYGSGEKDIAVDLTLS